MRIAPIDSDAPPPPGQAIRAKTAAMSPLAAPLLLTLVCALAGGCGGPPGPAPEASTPRGNAAERVIDEDALASGSELTVTAGEVFQLALRENATTGYRWEFGAPYDEAILKLLDDTVETPDSPGRVGVGGTRRWRFEALAAGTTTVRLRYVRPWEQDAEPARQAALTVTVQQAAGR
ncbi:MAG: protease inhibitor I42 family protein [Candidatus Hydrogenedentes bacterium]|nr:protease inhibitor I42 family protein [Candidatus Hydrogenedentota bacterium]